MEDLTGRSHGILSGKLNDLTDLFIIFSLKDLDVLLIKKRKKKDLDVQKENSIWIDKASFFLVFLFFLVCTF